MRAFVHRARFELGERHGAVVVSFPATFNDRIQTTELKMILLLPHYGLEPRRKNSSALPTRSVRLCGSMRSTAHRRTMMM